MRQRVESGTRFHRAGFTLAEIMVAVAILGVCLVSLLVVRNRSLAGALEARNLLIAVSLAEQKMGDIVVEGGGHGGAGVFPEHERFMWRAAAETVEKVPAGRLCRIRLVVSYPAGGGTKMLALSTYRFERARR
jgi:prepilin-type N-terminal cleavage/methylation domain-containing protein